jgi:peroxiredoxin/flavodoxin
MLVLILAGCTNENKFSVEGRIEGAEQEKVYFKRLDVGQTQMLDSTRTDQDGEFEFSGETQYPKFYNIAMNGKFATLLIKPGEEVKFDTHKDNFYEYTIKGSPGSRYVKRLESNLRKTKSQLDSLKNLYQQVQKKENSDQRIAEINEQYRRILNRQRDSSIAFIVNHLGSLASIMALYQKVDEETFVLYKNTDLQYIKLVSDSLKDKYPQSRHVKSLLANKEDLMKKYRNLKLQQTLSKYGEESNYPNIELPNLRGDTISLRDLDEKIILVSFWASWSNPSIQRNLELKPLYNRYHNKGFEIYQVSLDQEREEWQKAVNFDQLPWINVSSLNGLKTYAARIYNVQDLPTDFLIHQDRGVIAKNPDKEELRRRLSIALD